MTGDRRGRPTGGLRSDARIFLIAVAAAFPGTLLALVLLRQLPLPPSLSWLSAGILVGWSLVLAAAAARLYRRPLETLANVIAALRVGDYSTRVRHDLPQDPAGLAFLELNALARALAGRRLGGMEAEALLAAVLAEIDVAILAIDDGDRIRFVNRFAGELLATPPEALEGRLAQELGLGELLELEAPATVSRVGPAAEGRFDVRRGTFRQGGRPHRLLVISEVSRALRQEERAAWRRLVRVLSHEINNSLAPIHSISGTLLDLLGKVPPPPDRDADLRSGLEVIAARSHSLSRFMTAYARWARLPPPRRRVVRVVDWVERVSRLESRLSVTVTPGPSLTLDADPDQLDQLLINLVGNAVEAARETGGGVEVRWRASEGRLVLEVLDEGAGLASTENLFVPFFTTKPGGSGIGLVLSREVAEAHGGSLTLANRDGPRTGCVATLTIPVVPE